MTPPNLEPMALADWLEQQSTHLVLPWQIRRYIYILGGYPRREIVISDSSLGGGGARAWAGLIRANATNHDPIVAAFIAQKLTGEIQ